MNRKQTLAKMSYLSSLIHTWPHIQGQQHLCMALNNLTWPPNTGLKYWNVTMVNGTYPNMQQSVDIVYNHEFLLRWNEENKENVKCRILHRLQRWIRLNKLRWVNIYTCLMSQENKTNNKQSFRWLE